MMDRIRLYNKFIVCHDFDSGRPKATARRVLRLSKNNGTFERMLLEAYDNLENDENVVTSPSPKDKAARVNVIDVKQIPTRVDLVDVFWSSKEGKF